MNIFDGISDTNREKILTILKADIVNFKKNNTILSSMKSDNIIGIILEGYVQIIKTDFNGNRSIVEEIYENNIFGTSISGIKNSEYSIYTREDTKIILFYFEDVIKNEINTTYYTLFLKNLLSLISDKVSSANDRIEILSNKTIRNKLLTYFKIISKKNKSRIIYLPYTYLELADYLGVDRSAMYRELKSLREDELISVKGRKITLNMYNIN